MCFVLASHFVMTTKAAIDRDRHFENLQSRSFSSFFFLTPEHWKLKLLKTFSCHLFEKVPLKLSLTSFSHSEKKTCLRKPVDCLCCWPDTLKTNSADGAWKNWQSCGGVIYCTLCIVSRFALGSFIPGLGFEVRPNPFHCAQED